jgi:selenocysteine-specific elongation factor
LVAGRLVAREIGEDLASTARAVVGHWHEEHRLEPGIPIQLLRSKIAGSGDIVSSVIDAEISAVRLEAVAGSVRLPGWIPTPTTEQSSLLQTLVSQLEEFGAEPPSVEEFSASLGSSVADLLRYLERRGDVVQVEQNRYYAPHQLGLLVERVRGAMAGGLVVGPAELREALGLSRKYLIPLLEYCDRAGYTVRSASGRVWKGA